MNQLNLVCSCVLSGATEFCSRLKQSDTIHNPPSGCRQLLKVFSEHFITNSTFLSLSLHTCRYLGVCDCSHWRIGILPVSTTTACHQCALAFDRLGTITCSQYTYQCLLLVTMYRGVAVTSLIPMFPDHWHGDETKYGMGMRLDIRCHWLNLSGELVCVLFGLLCVQVWVPLQPRHRTPAADWLRFETYMYVSYSLMFS